MAFESATRYSHPILFGLLLLFSIIEGCDTAYLTGVFNSGVWPSHSIRDRVRFLLFVSWWTVVFSAGYIAIFWTAADNFLASIASHGIWLFVTWVFWLAGAAALTAALGGGEVCSHSNLVHCNQIVAAEAFAWINFIVITIAFVLVVVLGVGAMRRGDRLSAGLV